MPSVNGRQTGGLGGAKCGENCAKYLYIAKHLNKGNYRLHIGLQYITKGKKKEKN